MKSDGWERGRQSFPLTDRHKDYSGRELHSLYLIRSDALSHAFLNGVSIDDCAFVKAKIDHCELAESTIARSAFEKSSLAVSDMVRATVRDTNFNACDFSNGEWRETKFERVRFRACNFKHTTINLCTFSKCEFLGDRSAALDHRSVSYNTFSKCTFEHSVADALVISRNFGLPALPQKVPPLPVHQRMTLEQVCALSSSGNVTVANLAQAIESEFALPKPRLKKLRLEFISNIVSLLAQERRISPSSLIYIEELFLRLAKSALNESDFLAAMGALVNVRNALFAVATDARAREYSDPEPCDRIVLKFKSAFSQKEAEVFVSALSEVVFGSPGDILIQSIRPGSTVIECVFSVAATIGSVLAGLNLLLSQANTFVDRLSALRKKIHRLKGKKSQTVRNSKGEPASNVPAILNPDATLPYLITLRAAVERDGRILILFDEKARVSLARSGQYVKRRRQKV